MTADSENLTSDTNKTKSRSPVKNRNEHHKRYTLIVGKQFSKKEKREIDLSDLFVDFFTRTENKNTLVNELGKGKDTTTKMTLTQKIPNIFKPVKSIDELSARINEFKIPVYFDSINIEFTSLKNEKEQSLIIKQFIYALNIFASAENLRILLDPELYVINKKTLSMTAFDAHIRSAQQILNESENIEQLKSAFSSIQDTNKKIANELDTWEKINTAKNTFKNSCLTLSTSIQNAYAKINRSVVIESLWHKKITDIAIRIFGKDNIKFPSFKNKIELKAINHLNTMKQEIEDYFNSIIGEGYLNEKEQNNRIDTLKEWQEKINKTLLSQYESKIEELKALATKEYDSKLNYAFSKIKQTDKWGEYSVLYKKVYNLTDSLITLYNELEKEEKTIPEEQKNLYNVNKGKIHNLINQLMQDLNLSSDEFLKNINNIQSRFDRLDQYITPPINMIKKLGIIKEPTIFDKIVAQISEITGWFNDYKIKVKKYRSFENTNKLKDKIKIG